MKLISLKKGSIYVPENWNELSAVQLRQIMDILFQRKYKTEVMLLQLLRVLFNMTPLKFKRVSVYDIEEFLYLVSFLLQPEIAFTKNPLDCYRHMNSFGLTTKFYGPDHECSNLIMKEFVFTEDFFIRWFDNKEDLFLLNDLVAILYRPGKKNYDFQRNPDGDPREPFNQNVCAFNAKQHIQFWPTSVKLGIAYFYSGCRKKFVEDNPDVFNGAGGDPARYGLVSVMRNVAKDGIHGDFSKVEDTYVNLILMELNEVVDEAERLKRSMPS